MSLEGYAPVEPPYRLPIFAERKQRSWRCAIGLL